LIPILITKGRDKKRSSTIIIVLANKIAAAEIKGSIPNPEYIAIIIGSTIPTLAGTNIAVVVKKEMIGNVNIKTPRFCG